MRGLLKSLSKEELEAVQVLLKGFRERFERDHDDLQTQLNQEIVMREG